MRGREEPPSSEGGSHWRVPEKDMRSTTLRFSGIVGGTACKRKVSSINTHDGAVWCYVHYT